MSNALTPEDELLQEQITRRQLRTLAWVVGVLSAGALALSFVEAEMHSYGKEATTTMPIWDWLQRGWLVIAVAPVVWVYRSPRKHPVLVAGGWFAITGLVLKLFDSSNGWSDDWGAAALSAFCVVTIAAIVIVVMPVLRLRRREQAELVPTARLHGD